MPAPKVKRSRSGPELVFEPYRLPAGFTMQDHTARVRELGAAFVASITQTVADYRVAAEYAAQRFSDSAQAASAVQVDYPTGGARPTCTEAW